MIKLAELFTTRARTEGPVDVSGAMTFMWATIAVPSEACLSRRYKPCCTKPTFTRFAAPALPKSAYEFLGVVGIPIRVCTLKANHAKRPKCKSMQTRALSAGRVNLRFRYVFLRSPAELS
jgi:hypothetical protein